MRSLVRWRTRNGTKKAAAQLGTAAFARRFCSEVSHSRASAGNPVPSQATVVISYPVGRPTLALAIPNAYCE
jgi:hypothetical protein